MRIAYLAWQGSEHTRRWAGFFASRGHDVHVVTCGGVDTGPGPDVNYEIHDLHTSSLGKTGYLLRVPRVRRLVRSLKPDVVHAHHATSYGLLAACTGVHPLVVTCHGSDILVSGKKRSMRPLLKRVLDAADLVTVPGEHVANAVHELGTRTEVVVFQYGVEVERLRSLGTAANRSSGAPGPIRLVSARGLDPIYHTDEVLGAMAILRERDIDCVFDLAGRGADAERLERLARDLDVADQVVFHGHVPEDVVELLIARGDVFVSVPSSDGVSIALFEAMALGTVPLVSDIAANRLWIRDGMNGVVVQITSASIADGILRAVSLERAEVHSRNLEIAKTWGDREKNLASCGALVTRLVEQHHGSRA